MPEKNQQTNAKKFCFKCGAEIFEEAEICPKCGVRQLTPVREVKPTQVISSKGTSSPGVATILSFLFPGLGHIYLGDIFFGLIVMVVYACSWGLAIITALICSPIPILIWIWSMYNSYNLALKINKGEVE
ncbi:hypothetical protein KKE92_05330 [Candidatus Micrarchaeota archaeon]|nr:hypothetical protein [Candidatus Micrarchaeota archaeon]MBU1681805.1 hypothetical protein [Candidatus Micrarchaeota archaeon]